MNHLSKVPRVPLIRFAIAAVILVPFTIYMLPTGTKLLLTFYLGMALPAIGVATLVGFLSWSWKWLGIVLGVGLVLTVAIRLLASVSGYESVF
jgi:hypothetical protein